jgi:hypothetical protein
MRIAATADLHFTPQATASVTLARVRDEPTLRLPAPDQLRQAGRDAFTVELVVRLRPIVAVLATTTTKAPKPS